MYSSSYCECFASGRYCDGCNCANCCNNHENETIRQAAVEGILERNPNAFRPKIQAGMVRSHLDNIYLSGVCGIVPKPCPEFDFQFLALF